MNNVVETKIKKIYLLDNKNDIYQKKSLEYLKKSVVRSVLDTYKGESIEEKELNKFISRLSKSFILYTLGPTINRAIRFGMSSDIVDCVFYHPRNIFKFKNR